MIIINGDIHQGNILLEILLILLIEISLRNTRLVIQEITILTSEVSLISIPIVSS
jgi:hypothetical protein